MPGTLKLEKLTTHPGSDLRQLEIQYNNGVKDAALDAIACSTDVVWSWQTAAANSGQALGRGSTDTNLATGKVVFAIAGIPEAKAAVAAGTALGALGTIPASTWGVIAVDVATGGTISYVSGAANYTTGYSTEADAIAALPARVTAKARLGYITVKASASTWVAGTDALAGGATGNPATTTNYYPNDGVFCPTGQAVGPNGVVTAADNASDSTGSAWTGGRNGVIIATTLSRGSTDTRVGLTAFTYSANGVTNLAKGAVAAGTAFGALGTIPASKWGIIVMMIDSLGTQTYLSGPSNYTTGYNTEAQAIGDLSKIFPTATATGGLCRFGYVTIKASASGFVVGTDALAGGSSGNPASGTNYYPTAGVTLTQGQAASLLANREGRVLTSAMY